MGLGRRKNVVQDGIKCGWEGERMWFKTGLNAVANEKECGLGRDKNVG